MSLRVCSAGVLQSRALLDDAKDVIRKDNSESDVNSLKDICLEKIVNGKVF